MTPRILIAGNSSGVGKTTLTLGIIAALRERGLAVQPFKAGPDYIDPTYHTLAAGRPCRNLDVWMIPKSRAVSMFAHATAGADLAVIEGVMGLFDGFSYADENGSTAEIAKLTRTPVLLVLDVGKMARSAGALALGYARFDPDLPLAGFLLNRCGSPRHCQGVRRAVEQTTGLPVLGWLTKDARLHIPERHLGLVPTNERGELNTFVARAADVVRHHIDLDAILRIARQAPKLPSGEDVFDRVREMVDIPGGAVPLAVAQDEAFSFYYQDNLDLLEAAGAAIRPFSPLRDGQLPPDVRGIYIGGGFPELYAEALAANQPLFDDLRAAHARGLPIYAECGGFMYLSQGLTDLEGQRHAMAGLAPGEMIMTPKLAGLGYRAVTSPRGNFLIPAGETLRGHEFHWSRWSEQEGLNEDRAAWRVQPRRAGASSRLDGYANGNLLASYIHMPFATDLRLAINFVRAAMQQHKT
ncbi:MAG TPA: cobyrinate a,c-diamide synthase [Caldilineae bacterium]|nr:cobyrinate a,c-diamide synthase [Caldilineae bacterium]